MSKNKARAISLIILATIILSLIPINFASAVSNVTLSDYEDVVGEEITVEGEDVTAGATVNIYWDLVQAWNPATGQGLIASTTAESDGSFDYEFEVPEATNGEHWVWVEDTDTNDKLKADAAFVVITDVDLSSESGLEDDDITVEGTGFEGDADIAIILFADYGAALGTPVPGEETGESGDGDETEFSFTTEESPIRPTTLVVKVDGAIVFTDDGDGGLVPVNPDDEGSVNYVTGDVELEFDEELAEDAEITVDYSYYDDDPDEVYIFTSGGDSDAVGSLEETITIPEPEDMIKGTYELVVLDSDGNEFVIEFIIGAVIELKDAEATVGTIIKLEGRGFVTGGVVDYINLELNGDVFSAVIWDEDDPNVVDDDEEFDIELVVPQVEEEDDDYKVVVSVDGIEVSADFEVTALAKIEVTPTYGLPGEEVMIKGTNFIHESGEEVTITLNNEGKETFETDNDGSFEGTYIIPGVEPDTHDLVADQSDYNIMDDTSFKAGLIVVVATPDSVKAGEAITFTGTGFTPGSKYNGTFGDITIEDEGDVLGTGTFSKTYYVPTIEPGDYQAVFIDDIEDDAEITVVIDITVTENTYITVDPGMAPNDYNITIMGWNFKNEEELELEFFIYNDTEEWEITGDVKWYDEEEDEYTDDDVWERDTTDGNFSAWWTVEDDEEMSLGTYTIKVMYDDDKWVAETIFELVSQTVTVAPLKSAFRIGDTVAFNIVNSFAQEGSYIEIEDPSGNLYWETDPLEEWVKVGTTERVPYYAQTAYGNPMILVSDAPLGTWSYEMFDDEDEEIGNGTFSVIEAPEAVLEQRINELSEDIADVQDQIAGVQDQVTDAAEAADAATQAANEAKTAVQGLESVATSAKDAADDAKAAAEDAKDAATGIQTLVYVAIAGSVIAALAAIVSLMQISRRIAG
jgi:hypothetical protein